MTKERSSRKAKVSTSNKMRGANRLQPVRSISQPREVHAFLRSWQSFLPRTDEIVAEALLGLLKAGWGFRPARGFKFSTYACWSIRRTLWHWCKEHTENRACQVYDELTIDHVTQEEDRGHVAMLEADERARAARRRVQRLLKKLPDRERLVIEGRYLHGKTLQGQGDEIGLSKERVRQLVNAGLRRMAVG